MTYLDKQISLSWFHTAPIWMQTTELVPHLLHSLSEGPRFPFLLVSAFHSSLHQCHYPPPPNPPPAFKLLCLLSLRLSCHFHRTQSKVEITIIQTPHRCLSQERADKNQLPCLNMPPAGGVGGGQRGISIADVHVMFILTSTC